MDEQVVPSFNVHSNNVHQHDLNAPSKLVTKAATKAVDVIKHYKKQKKQQQQKQKHAKLVVAESEETQTVPSTTNSESSTGTTNPSFSTASSIVPSNPYTPERKKPDAEQNQVLVGSEYLGKLRWQTPRRIGKWKEPWHSAIQLCPLKLHSPISIQSSISMILRNTLSKAIVTYVGPLLSSFTVNKWLCLLCEYLELNTDEEILVICLLRRYSKAGGQFITINDWRRPQKWECVVAIACYLAVLLTEEFPGKTILDLKELLGTEFKFGSEQVQFLKCIDWKICIHSDEIKDILSCCKRCISGDVSAYSEMDEWFSAQTRDVSDAKLWDTDNGKNEKTRERVSVVVEPETASKCDGKVNDDSTADVHSKKRSHAAFVNGDGGKADEGVVPQYVIRRIDPSLSMNPAFIYHQPIMHPGAAAVPPHIIPTAMHPFVAQQAHAIAMHQHQQHADNNLVAAHLAAAAAAGMPSLPMHWGAPGL